MYKDENNVRKGWKRKRNEFHQELDIKLQGKLHHDLNEVKKAAKKAKTHEIQKLIKKLKDSQPGTSSAISDAEQELELLKGLNHEAIAITAFQTKINKVGMLRDSEQVQAALATELAFKFPLTIPSTLQAKVQSRLLSSKMLASQIAAVVEDLKRILQPDDGAKDEANNVVATDEVLHAKRMKKLKVTGTGANPTMANLHLQEPQEAEEAEDDESDYAGWESGTVNSGDSAAESDPDRIRDGNDSTMEPDDDSNGPPKTIQSSQFPKTLRTKAPEKPTGLRSTFLPSLSVGFARGGSDDSDISEDEIRVADLDVKKNRRGQRARRAIWEKKYGKNAIHKVKEREYEHTGKSIQHSSARQGASQRHKNANGMASSRNANSGRPPPISPTSRGGGFKEAKVEKPLHPSWEAKRKVKEKERAIIVPSQGHKIKFS